MGRKSKLKNDKRRAAAAAVKMNNNNNQEVSATESAARVKVKGITTLNDYADYVDNDFPKSDLFVQVISLTKENYNEVEVDNKLMRGAKEYGCVHSMFMISRFRIQSNLGQPWLLEACILGSLFCAKRMLLDIYAKGKPCPPKALAMYWMKMLAKYEIWSGIDYDNSSDKSKTKLDHVNIKDTAKKVKDRVVQSCAICSQEDTDTLTLRQCTGCSTYCYCSEVCQKVSWEEHNHKGECRQLKMLNKYHKPYAKEIRKAAIRGEKHPALEKLRSKLGLSRPIEDYQDFSHSNTHKGKPIDPYEFVVAREDGTVWVGSTPTSIGPFSDTATTTTSATTTTTTPPPTPPTTTSDHDEVPALYGIGGNNRPSIEPGRKAIIHNLQSKSSLYLKSNHCIIRKILPNGRVAVEVDLSNNNNVAGNNNSKLEDTKTIAILPINLEMVLEIN